MTFRLYQRAMLTQDIPKRAYEPAMLARSSRTTPGG